MQNYNLPSDKARQTPLYTALDMKKDLEFLEKKIDKVSREASVWDFYKITDIVNDKNNTGTMIKNLLPGESIIINTPTFKFNNETLSRGDILFKKNALEYVKIAAERGGTFFPYQIEKVGSGNSYNINFKFFNGSIKTGQTTVKNVDNKWIIPSSPSEELVFQELISADSSPVYSQNISLIGGVTSFEVTGKKVGNQAITPLIKFYTAGKELIEIEYSLTMDGTKWQCNFENNSLINYAVVK